MQWRRWKRDLLFRYRNILSQTKSFEAAVTRLSEIHLVSESAIIRELEVQETAESIGILRLSSRQRAINRMLQKKESQ